MLLTNYRRDSAGQARALGGQLNPTQNLNLGRMNTFYVGSSNRVTRTNVVKNGDFEIAPSTATATTTSARFVDGTASGTQIITPSKVYVYSISPGSGSVLFDRAEKFSGNVSLKVSTTAVASQIGASLGYSSGYPRDIPVLPSTSYTYSFWMKTTVNSGSSASGAFLYFEQQDSSGTYVNFNVTSLVNTTTGWTNYTGTITTDPTTAYIVIVMYVKGDDGAGTLVMDAWFDDVQLYLTNQITEVNYSLMSSLPNSGYRPPYSLVLAPKAGGMSAHNTTYARATATASGQMGVNLDSVATVSVSAEATLQLVASLLGTAAVAITSSADLKGIAGLEGTSAVAVTSTADIFGTGRLLTSTPVTVTGAADIFATGSMHSLVYLNQSQATVDQIVDGVVDGIGSITATIPDLLNTETGDVIIPLD